MFEVLKKFKYSPNGIKVVEFQKGDVVEIVSESVKSLEQGGYIKAKKATKTIEQAPDLELETKPAPTSRRSNK